MQHSQIRFLFLNIGHFVDHWFVLIFASVAALRLSDEWGMSYAELIPYATPGFIAFGVCAIPAGWLADKWSREGMMVIFFLGIGLAGVLTGLAETPLQIAAGLTLIGVFAAIYHPVGLAMVVQGRSNLGMALAVNGVAGNLGVASAALLTGVLIDQVGWRSAFVAPGVLVMLLGGLYLLTVHAEKCAGGVAVVAKKAGSNTVEPLPRDVLLRVFYVLLFTAAVGGLVFQATTFSLPKVFDEQLTELAGSATLVGWYAFWVFAVAALAQLVVGYLIDKHSLRGVFVVVAGLQTVFLFAMTQFSGAAVLPLAIGFMLAVFGQIPINDALVARVVSAEWRSRAYSLKYIVNFGISASAVPLIAWIHQGWGFATLFALLAIGAAAITAAALTLPQVERVLLPARPAA